MCGSLKLEGRDYQINDNIHKYKWVGHSRSDSSRDKAKLFKEQWSSKSWKIKLLNIKSFTEKGKVIKPIGKILAIANKRTRELRIVTRESRNQQEQVIHNRMPVQVSEKWEKGFLEFFNKKTEDNYSYE